MDLDAIFGGGGSSTDVEAVDALETVEADAEIEETEENDGAEEVEESDEAGDGLGWQTLLLFLLGGSVLLGLVIALMWWVIGGVVDGN